MTLKNLVSDLKGQLAEESEVAKTILAQMGGPNKVRAMLGAQIHFTPNSLVMRWPNKQRSKGNFVEIILADDDTYTMEFFNVGKGRKKLVKTYSGIYADQLVDIFEKQTGWSLRL